MSETTSGMITSTQEFSFRHPVLRCPKHGAGQVGVQFYWTNKPTKIYCMECYHDLIAQFCCEVVQES